MSISVPAIFLRFGSVDEEARPGKLDEIASGDVELAETVGETCEAPARAFLASERQTAASAARFL